MPTIPSAIIRITIVRNEYSKYIFLDAVHNTITYVSKNGGLQFLLYFATDT